MGGKRSDIKIHRKAAREQEKGSNIEGEGEEIKRNSGQMKQGGLFPRGGAGRTQKLQRIEKKSSKGGVVRKEGNGN